MSPVETTCSIARILFGPRRDRLFENTLQRIPRARTPLLRATHGLSLVTVTSTINGAAPPGEDDLVPEYATSLVHICRSQEGEYGHRLVTKYAKTTPAPEGLGVEPAGARRHRHQPA